MWSTWFDDVKKKAGEALKVTSQAVSDGLKVAKEKVVSENAADVMKEVVSRRPEDLTYITNNIIAMGFPGWPQHPNPAIKYNMREIVASFLESHHKDHYMIFNLSDETYETMLFNDHVISYDLMGMPAPSLGMLLKMCVAMETYLSDSPENVVVVHCLTGKGRTLTVCACLLAWLGWVESASEGLHLCCDRRGGQVEALTTPSQRRYVQYFSRLLDCEPLKREALLLRSVHLEELPLEGASPAVQVDVFNCGTLVFATRVALAAGARSVDIVCGRVIRGNIVVRVREVCADGSRRSVCRCMVHTGYVSGTVRLQKEQLDGACNDPRCSDAMCLELRVEETAEEYKPDAAGNRLEVYESLLLDTSSALWRELLYRKERRNASVSVNANANATATATATAAAKEGEAEKGSAVFDIDSEEEKPLPVKDPSRDYLLELALLEDELANKPATPQPAAELFSASEEQSLDTLMQSLDMSDEEGEEAKEPLEPLDLDQLAATMESSENEEGHDFNSEFGV